MKSLSLVALSLAGAFLLSTQASAASFDCNKASTWVEKTVCADSKLSKLDEALALKYKNELAESANFEDSKSYKNRLINEQRSWLKFQRNTCQETECLVREYQERVDGKVQFGTTILNSNELGAANTPSTSAFGEFSETVSISMYDPATEHMDQGNETTNTLSIYKISGKPHLAIIDGVLIFTNAHTCYVGERKAIWSENHWAITEDNQGKDAELRLYPATHQGKTQLLLRDPDNKFREQNCGMRGYFDGIVLDRG